MRLVALKGYLGCEKQALFFSFGKNWADIKKRFIHVKNFWEIALFLLCQVDS